MPGINKYASIVYRISQTYFDECLHQYHIGSGQQFFLLRIFQHPGISQQELAEKGYYDKGTTARAVKKLEQEGYILRKANDLDKRVIQLYVSKKGEALIPIIEETIAQWRTIITEGFSEDERDLLEKGMKDIAANARAYAKGKSNRKRVEYGNESDKHKD